VPLCCGNARKLSPLQLSNSTEQSPSWEPNRFSVTQDIPRIFFGTHRFITSFTRARQLSPS
jgi:hypothetical protein